MRAKLSLASAILGISCSPELRVQLPEAPAGAASLIVAIEGHDDQLLLIARDLDDPGSAFSIDTRADRLTLIYLAEELDALGVAGGPLGPSKETGGSPLPDPLRIYEASFAGGAFREWTTRPALSERIASYRLPVPPKPESCASFTSQPLSLPTTLPIAFSVALDDRSALFGTLDCRLFTVRDPQDSSAPIPVEVEGLRQICDRDNRYTEAVRDDDGTIWMGRHDGKIDHFPAPPDFRHAETETTAASGLILSMTTSRGTPERELYAIDEYGRLQKREPSGRWIELWQDPEEKTYQRIAWIAPGELLVANGTACLRRWREADPASIETCEAVGEEDTLQLITSVALVPGIGSVIGTGVFGGAFAGYGALFANDTSEPGRWSLLALMQPVGAVISPAVIVPLDRGLFFGGFVNMIGQFHPPAATACDVRQLAADENATSWSDVVSFRGERLLITGVPVDVMTGVEGTAQWLVRAR